MLKKALLLGFWACCGLGGAVGLNTWRFESRQPPPQQADQLPELGAEASLAALQRLSLALQTQTLAQPDLNQNPNAEFDKLHELLAQSFPQLYQQLQPQRLGHSLLLTWPGQKPERQGLLLAAHLDVVPVEQAQSWTHPPFSGTVAAGFVWGRGALDDKNSAMALLEAFESLLKSGFQPQQTLYLALGEDEEIGGQRGAMRLAAHLQAQGVRLEAVLDEGLAIVPGSMVGLEPPVALIGIAEKGYLSVALTVSQAGGHASMPARETAVSVLAQALVRLQKQPLPARLSGPALQLFAWLGPEMQGFDKVALANLWLFEPLLKRQLGRKPATNALIRTSLAPTQLSASPKDNVLASEARAVLNLRLLPGDSPEAVLAHLQRAIADKRVQVEALNDISQAGASRVSSTDSAFFQALSQSIRQIYPEALVAPSLVLAATDARHYEALADNVYRFMPVFLSEQDLDRIHGKDERIATESYLQAIRFYQQLLLKL